MNFMILILLYLSFSFALTTESPKNIQQPNQMEKQTQEGHEEKEEDPNTQAFVATLEPVLKIKVLPYISIVNKDTLKTYKWWLAEDKKVPSVYKQFLKKLMTDLRSEAISLKYEFMPTPNIDELDKEKLKSLEINYILTGEMIYDRKNKKGFAVTGFKIKSIDNESDIFFQKNGQVNSLKDLNFLISDLVAHLRTRQEPGPTLLPVTKNNLFLKFQIELSFNEIEKIMEQIISEVPTLQDVKIYTLQGAETTLALYPKETSQAKSIFAQISDLHFLKGPYNKTIEDKTLILKPYTLEDETQVNAKPQTRSKL